MFNAVDATAQPLNDQASNDELVIIQPFSSSASAGVPPKTHAITHFNAVKAILPLSLTTLAEPYLLSASGDVVRLYEYDFTAPDDPPELLGEIDAHWHDVTALGLWIRVFEKDGKTCSEPWILSASLDATLRRWKIEGIQSSTQINQLLNDWVCSMLQISLNRRVRKIAICK